METTSMPGCTQIHGHTNRLLRGLHNFVIQPRGKIPVKGKGELFTWWLRGVVPPRERLVLLRASDEARALAGEGPAGGSQEEGPDPSSYPNEGVREAVVTHFSLPGQMNHSNEGEVPSVDAGTLTHERVSAEERVKQSVREAMDIEGDATAMR